MKKHYFLIGAFVGLLSAFFLAWFIMREGFLNLFSISIEQKYFGAVPILFGAFVVLLYSHWLDKKKYSFAFAKSTLFFPAVIFMFGVLAGCLMNWAVNEGFSDFYDYFIKPFYWLTVTGLPTSMIVGLIYFFINKKAAAKP